MNLRWLQLRGNLIRKTPSQWFLPTTRIEILDLSHNLLQSLTKGLFTRSHKEKRDASSHPFSTPESHSLSIGDLHLDFNELQEVESLVNVSIRRLSLSNNKLSSLPDHLFQGMLGQSLQALDLNFNLLAIYPKCLKGLQRITSLFLRGNQLRSLDQDSFIGCKDHLQSLDLSSNSFLKIPALALRPTTRLLRLNLQDNHIRRIEKQDLSVWASSLLSLSLSKNEMQDMDMTAFKQATSLKELRLSFNRLQRTAMHALHPLRQGLLVLELTSAFAAPDAGLVSRVASLTPTIEWLELDLNSLTFLSNDSFSSLASLTHLDLEGNSITHLPKALFHGNNSIHSYKGSILVSHYDGNYDRLILVSGPVFR